jgi:hypothetical protein
VADADLQKLDPQDVKIQGELNVSKPGAYQLVYSYAKDKLAGKTAITVIVTEKEA